MVEVRLCCVGRVLRVTFALVEGTVVRWLRYICVGCCKYVLLQIHAHMRFVWVFHSCSG